MSQLLQQLDARLRQRRSAGDPANSYTARLFRDHPDQTLRKIGEEATEVILAAKQAEQDQAARPELVAEVADLWFHCMVAMIRLGTDSDAVLAELARRMDHGSDAGDTTSQHSTTEE